MPNDPMKIAGEVLGLSSTLGEYAKQAVNAVNPGGTVTYPSGVSDQAYERLKQDFKENYSGVVNTGKFILLEEGGVAHPFERDMEKMQVLESRKHAVTEICRIWGVPPHLCMDLDKATFSNIEQQSLEFVRDCINPLSVRLEQGMFRDLLTETERLLYFFKFNTNGFLRGDTQTRQAYYNTMHQNGILNADEIRALEDFEKQPDGQGEIYMVNGNMVARKNVPLNLPKGMEKAQKGATQ
jgi:HK97 family phage portal protein